MIAKTIAETGCAATESTPAGGNGVMPEHHRTKAGDNRSHMQIQYSINAVSAGLAFPGAQQVSNVMIHAVAQQLLLASFDLSVLPKGVDLFSMHICIERGGTMLSTDQCVAIAYLID